MEELRVLIDEPIVGIGLAAALHSHRESHAIIGVDDDGALGLIHHAEHVVHHDGVVGEGVMAGVGVLVNADVVHAGLIDLEDAGIVLLDYDAVCVADQQIAVVAALRHLDGELRRAAGGQIAALRLSGDGELADSRPDRHPGALPPVVRDGAEIGSVVLHPQGEAGRVALILAHGLAVLGPHAVVGRRTAGELGKELRFLIRPLGHVPGPVHRRQGLRLKDRGGSGRDLLHPVADDASVVPRLLDDDGARDARVALGGAAVGAQPGVAIVPRAVTGLAEEGGLAAGGEIRVLRLGADTQAVFHPGFVGDGLSSGLVRHHAVVGAVADAGGIAGLPLPQKAAAAGAEEIRPGGDAVKIHGGVVGKFRVPEDAGKGLQEGAAPAGIAAEGRGGACHHQGVHGGGADGAAVVRIVPAVGIFPRAALGLHGHGVQVAAAPGDPPVLRMDGDVQVKGIETRPHKAQLRPYERGDRADGLRPGVGGIPLAGEGAHAGGPALRLLGHHAIVPVVPQGGRGLRPGLAAEAAGPGDDALLLAGGGLVGGDDPVVLVGGHIVVRRVGIGRGGQQRHEQQHRQQQRTVSFCAIHRTSSFVCPAEQKTARLDAKPCRDRPWILPAGPDRC